MRAPMRFVGPYRDTSSRKKPIITWRARYVARESHTTSSYKFVPRRTSCCISTIIFSLLGKYSRRDKILDKKCVIELLLGANRGYFRLWRAAQCASAERRGRTGSARDRVAAPQSPPRAPNTHPPRTAARARNLLMP